MEDGYPSDWNTRRKKVYRRDDFTCQNCGAKGGSIGTSELHAHHIVPKSNGGTHKLSNLKTVCSDCHKAIHGDSVAPTENPDPEHLPFDEWPLTVQAGMSLGVIAALYLTVEMGLLGFFFGCIVMIVFLIGSAIIHAHIDNTSVL